MVAEAGALTSVAVKNASEGRHYDGGGLDLQVKADVGKYWRFKYRFGGKEKLLSFGVFPKVGLAEARTRRAEARLQLRKGIDPGLAKADRLNNARRDAESTFPKVTALCCGGNRLRPVAIGCL